MIELSVLKQSLEQNYKEEVERSFKWVDYIHRRIRQNKNFMAIISGETGSGKTWAGIRICQLLDPEFNENRIVFTARELMNLINKGELKSGSCILWDETQIDLNNRNWSSVMNKLLNFLISTFRHRNFILIFTSPYTDFVDTATLKLFHANFQTFKLDLRTNTCILKPKFLQYNSENKKFYRKYLKVGFDAGKIKLKRWRVEKPDQELIDKYEKKKLEFTSKLNEEIEQKLIQLYKEENPQIISKVYDPNAQRKPPSKIQKQVFDLWTQGIFRTEEIAKRINRLIPQAYKCESELKRKGYSKEYYMELFKNKSI